jgi:cytochrome c oxidase assembly protein subunit 16
MAVFQNKKYRSAADSGSFAAKYRAMMAKRPFLLFGLPFMTVIIAGSFVLTPATAVRYEKHDRRVRQMTREEELGVGKTGRKVNMKDEYYVSHRGIKHQRSTRLLTYCVPHARDSRPRT